MNQSPTSTIQIKAMHRVVWSLITVFVACAITFPIAMLRVSQMEKFKGSHVKSLSERGTSISLKANQNK